MKAAGSRVEIAVRYGISGRYARVGFAHLLLQDPQDGGVDLRRRAAAKRRTAGKDEDCYRRTEFSLIRSATTYDQRVLEGDVGVTPGPMQGTNR